MAYRQFTREERHTLSALKKSSPRLSNREIAGIMSRSPSTISRELKRNCSPHDGGYRWERAQEMTNARRRQSRRNTRFSEADLGLVERLLREDWSPEQISGTLRRTGVLQISHETIYRYVWEDKRLGGDLYLRLRQRIKYRKRYGRYERRGRLLGKRHISERPRAVEQRRELGHWEMDTVIGTPTTKDCVVTLVERVTGLVLIGKLADRTAATLNRRVLQLIRKHRHLFRSITVDNGTEFHSYQKIERATGVTFYFATPYHYWERGTNENTNGLIRQYLPKRQSMSGVSQVRCSTIAATLNHRPRTRHGFFSPLEYLRIRHRTDL